MHVSEDGSVVGSVDRAKLADIEATSDEAKAQLAQLQGEGASAEVQVSEGQVVESGSVEPEPKVSMAQSKDELLDQAEAVGLGERDELELRTKQQLVDDINAKVAEG